MRDSLKLKLVLACLFAGVLAACSAPESEEELFARASTALSEGRVNAAIVDIKTVLQQNPDNAAARGLLGETYMIQRQPAAAAVEFLRAFDNGGALEHQVRYAQALAAAADADALLALNSGDRPPAAAADPRYLAAVARAHSLKRDFDAARVAIDRALSLDGDNPYVMTSEALVLLREGGKVFDAAEILERVTDANAANDEAWSLRADVARIEEDFASAAQWYAKAVEINPFRIAERLQLVDMHFRLGETDAADAELAQLEKLVPDHPSVCILPAVVFLVAEGEYEEGLQSLSRVLGVMPNHSGALYIAAIANAQQGNIVSAQRQLTKFIRDQPNHVPARLQLAGLHLRQSEAESAERLAREVLEEDDMNVQATRLLALALVAQGLYAESAQAYQDLASLQPDSMQDRAGLGAARLLSGDTDLGVQELEKALAMDPGNAGLRERIIAVHVALGDMDAARRAVEEYLAVADDDSRPNLLAARVALQSGNKERARALV